MKNYITLIILGFAMAQVVSAQQEVELTNLRDINTEHLEFSPIPWGDGIVFTSSKSNRFLKCPADNAGEYTDLFYAKRNEDGSFTDKQALKGKVNGKYNDGAATFNTLGNKMIFTRNNLNGRNEYDVIDLKLYTADLEDGQWVNVQELPFNSDEWSTCHPTLSSDGTLLLFASNRPGSVGGSMDIWGSRLVDGQWTEPFNLGPEVNTDSTEIFPYLDSEGNLFFSSKGHGGAGGLDIFAATADDSGNWSLAGGIGEPFNTAADDVNFVSINDGTEGYWASSGGPESQGLDDIYYFKRTPQPIEAVVVVIDEITGERLGSATVNVETTGFDDVLSNLYAKGIEPLNLTTDTEGSTKFGVLPKAKYNILAEKEGYEPATRTPTTAELTENPEYIIPLRKKVYLAKLTGIVADANTKARIPLANIKLRDKTTGEVIELIGNGNGEFTREINCDHEYEVMAAKESYDDSEWLPVAFDVNQCKEKGEVSVTIYLNRKIIVYFRPIFFDFDKYYIRKPDATATLDTIAQIMKQYPSLKVNLIGNCDARGRTEYNDVLGDNRAKSSKRYLVSKGISADRITTNSLGERKPINECGDNVYCTETKHQANRRVDVIPVEYNEPGVEFRTMDVKVFASGEEPEQ
ncbi:MAG: hypothetical protein Kow0027_09350 [Saprospiraceae bacterium]